MSKPKTKTVTLKNVPEDLWARVRNLSDSSGLRIEMIVRQALVMRLDAEVKR